jgi:electron transport complex protein RnfC
MPKNIEARIGTPVSYILERCGLNEDPTSIIAGGPMMGTAQYTTSVPVIKTTNAILALLDEPDKNEKNPVCIRCGRCVDVCPMGLMPYKICACSDIGKFEECVNLHVADCMECGSCSYVCPGRKNIVQAIRTAKRHIAE